VVLAARLATAIASDGQPWLALTWHHSSVDRVNALVTMDTITMFENEIVQLESIESTMEELVATNKL
jgi:hypothetical protein